jgi:hypothetical protein
MGYIGLLLNAPYKIDSMMEMSLMRMIFWFRLFCFFVCFFRLYELKSKIGM